MSLNMLRFAFAIFFVSEASTPDHLALTQQRTLTDARALIDGVRRLNQGDAVTIPAACATACPKVEAMVDSFEQELVTVMAKHQAAMNSLTQKMSNPGAEMDANALAELMQALEPMMQDMMEMQFNNMCSNKDTYSCIMANADKCGASPSSGGNMGGGLMSSMSVNPLESAGSYGKQIDCMCTVCPGTKKAYTQMVTTLMTTMMSALASMMTAMTADGGTGDASSSKAEEDKHKKALLEGICPMVGMSRCFEANPTECKGMLDEGILKLTPSSSRRLESSSTPTPSSSTSAIGKEINELDAECKKSGVSTSVAETTEKVVTVVTLKGVDYDKVMADAAAKADIIAAVKKQFLARMKGYLESDLTVTLSKGSVKAEVEIKPMPGANADIVKATVEKDKDTIAAAVATDVKNMNNVDSVLEAGKSKDQIEASASSPVASDSASTGKGSTSGASHAEFSMILVWFLASAANSVN